MVESQRGSLLKFDNISTAEFAIEEFYFDVLKFERALPFAPKIEGGIQTLSNGIRSQIQGTTLAPIFQVRMIQLIPLLT